MPMKRYEAKGGSSSRRVESEEPKMDIRSILKDLKFLGTFSLRRNQRLPLSVARVTMKKQKEREEKQQKESAILGRFGAYSSSGASKKAAQRRQPEDKVLMSTEGNFRNSVLDVKHFLQPSAPRAPSSAADNGGHSRSGKGKKKKGGKKKGGGGGKRKGRGKKRH